MDTEVIDLYHCCLELFAIVDKDKNLSEAVGLAIGDITITVSICEDNYGTLVFAYDFPPQFTHCSKYYISKTI